MASAEFKPELMPPPFDQLDWSQIRETVMMLNLAVAHITWSMKESDESVDTLANSFTSMAGAITALEDITKSLSGNMEADMKDVMADKCHDLSANVQAAIIAFQFYDRITQQLAHVCNSLTSLGELISDQRKFFRPYEWHALQDQIRSKYTMESERDMFDALMKGGSIEEVLHEAMGKAKESAKKDDIELF